MERFIDVFGLKKSKKLPDDELYVMLMLMRASEGSEPAKADCEDPMIKAACLLDSDKCPAECKDDAKEEDTVVKSGDLAVKATAATERKAILDNGVSDLDTITLKASEKITVNSITLERFGYSTTDDVESVWLEDEDGNKIADEKSLSTSKDTVTLKIKKEYREMDASNALTIVLKTAAFEEDHCSDEDIETEAECVEPAEWIKATYTAKKAGSTIGFKVTDVDASAKNLDISDYSPYTYDLVSYDGATVNVSAKGNNKEYNYEEGEYYEVSKLRVQAGASILSLNGITLTNEAPAGKTALDLDEFVSKVKVTADGKEVSGLKWNATKDNELVLSWDTIEVAIKKDVQIAVSIAMENLDVFGNVAYLTLKDGDLNATEKKTGARVSVTPPQAYKLYTFNGSKIKFSNTKLSSTIDAAQGSEDVVIAQGKVTVAEEIKISKLVLTADTANIIEDMTLSIAGEKYDPTVSTDKTTFTFKNVIIEKSGDVELSVDIADEDNVSGETVQVKFNGSTSISKALFADPDDATVSNNNGRYETSRKYVQPGDVSGSISISKLKVQESKASLKNNKSTTVEFIKDETSDRVTLFEGTYTAKKSDVTLKEFAIAGAPVDELAPADVVAPGDTTAEFYLYIDGEEVGNIEAEDIVTKDAAAADGFDSYEDFDEVKVAAGKSVKVEVKAVIAPDQKSNNINLDLYLRGEDKNGTAAGKAKAGLTTFKYVINGSLTISDSTTLAKKTVALQANDITLAKFTIKPSKSDSVKLDNLVFDFSDLLDKGLKVDGETPIDINDITVEVDGEEVDVLEGNWDEKGDAAADQTTYTKYDATSLDDITEEVEVEVKVTGLAAVDVDEDGDYTIADAVSLTLASINGIAKDSEYTRLVLPALAKVDSVSSDGAITKFRVNVEDYDGEQIQNMLFYSAHVAGEGEASTVSNGSVVEVTNQSTSEIVTKITFNIVKDTDTYGVVLENGDFPDYFKTTDGTTLRVSKISDK